MSSMVIGWIVVCENGAAFTESVGGVPIFKDYGVASDLALQISGSCLPAVQPQAARVEAAPRRRKQPVAASAEQSANGHQASTPTSAADSNGSAENDDPPPVLHGWQPRTTKSKAQAE